MSKVLGFLVLLFGIGTRVVFAQDSAGVATYVSLSGEYSDGSVICGTGGGSNKICDREYDPNMIGVITVNPAVSFIVEEMDGTVPMLSSGKAYVLVSSVNGTITIGDFITSSKIAGVSQKATKSGYILGSATEEYNESDPQKIGKIMVSLSVKPAVLKKNAEANLLQMIKDGVEGAFESPLSALRYVVSALIVSVIFIFGFIHFGKIAKSGVESIGRNPLASRAIQTGVIMNMGITVVIMGASVFVAYMILVI
ncbi:MAG: hypothetical protein AAB535_03920 [Patescibacteria group bacterium]